jgi:four helix bundle protein
VHGRGISTNVLSGQLVRSATSIGANIVEAQAGRTKKDFSNFLSHALKSANETKFWLRLLRDSEKSEKECTEKLLNEATELSKILGASIVKIRREEKSS